MQHINKIIELIQSDELRLNALECVRLLALPDCYIAAGFVRNLVWDSLHNKSQATQLNDVDVIYFDLTETNPTQYQQYELQLKEILPALNWQVRNQAIMHLRNNDEQYKSSLNAMNYWPEKETAIGIRKLTDGSFECIAAFGFDSLFNFKITHNPKREKSIFEQRVASKQWLTTWKNLQVIY